MAIIDGMDYSPGGLIMGTSPMRTSQLLEQYNSVLNEFYLKSHYSQVRYFRKKFPEYSKEEFRNISKDPIVKEIMAGAAKIGAEEAVERIKLYVEDL